MNTVTMTVSAVRSAEALPAFGYKDILVHLDGSSEDETRLSHAEALATLFGSHLRGLYTNMLPDVPMYGGEFGIVAMANLSDTARREGDQTFARLQRRFERVGVVSDLRRIDSMPNFLEQKVASEARNADLFVASGPYVSTDQSRWRNLIETVLFNSGHALYLVPPASKPRQAIKTVLIGWIDSREASRAIAEALPLLVTASQVHLVTYQGDADGSFGGAEAMSDIAAHLHRHGAQPTVTVLTRGEDVGAALLAEAHRVSADLIVAGAYGHSRFREWLLGGATYDLIAQSDLPILMAH